MSSPPIPAPANPGYRQYTMAQALAMLADRLGDQTNVYWSAAELRLYIVEALRTWQALTASFRTRAVLDTNEGQVWYDLTAALETSFGYSVKDQDIAAVILYHLLEAQLSGGAWAGTAQFTLSQVQAAIQNRLNRFRGDSGMVLDLVYQVAGTAGRPYLDPSIIDIRRAAWNLQPFTISGTVVSGLLQGNPGWFIGTAQVRIWLSGDADAMITPNRDGTYSFPNLPNGNYTVTVTVGAYGYYLEAPTSQAVTINQADAPNINFRFDNAWLITNAGQTAVIWTPTLDFGGETGFDEIYVGVQFFLVYDPTYPTGIFAPSLPVLINEYTAGQNFVANGSTNVILSCSAFSGYTLPLTLTAGQIINKYFIFQPPLSAGLNDLKFRIPHADTLTVPASTLSSFHGWSWAQPSPAAGWGIPLWAVSPQTQPAGDGAVIATAPLTFTQVRVSLHQLFMLDPATYNSGTSFFHDGLGVGTLSLMFTVPGIAGSFTVNLDTILNLTKTVALGATATAVAGTAALNFTIVSAHNPLPVTVDVLVFNIELLP